MPIKHTIRCKYALVFVCMFASIGLAWSQESWTKEVIYQKVHIEYGLCSIGIQEGDALLVFELTFTSDNKVSYIARAGRCGEDGEEKNGALEEVFHDTKEPNGRIMDVELSSVKIIRGDLHVAWSSSNHDGGWLYIPQGYKIFVLPRGAAKASLRFVPASSQKQKL